MAETGASAEETDSRVKLEDMVARSTGATSHHDAASLDRSYVGSMVDNENVFPEGVRHRVVEPPIGNRLGYHELGDEKEEADMDWMLGEASRVSGDGSRGSRNWILALLLPLLIILTIFCMHQWWYEIKKGASHVVNKVSDAVDRRLEVVNLKDVPAEETEMMFLFDDTARTVQGRQGDARS